ncbi:MAG TPA: PepSY domain-containing protein [Steroidobacteraceae bacterium]|nr:PepSY domain-containing protein [Steroidobacteraceae bacterium]
MRFLRKLHKWLGLVIGLQVVLWAVSGLVFAWLDRDTEVAASVRGVEPAVLSSTMVKTEPAAWLGDYSPQKLYDVRAIRLAERWVWRVELQDRVELRAVEDGSRVNVDEAWLRRMALERYAGGGRLIAATLQTEPDIASRAGSPVWQAQFDDPQRTSLYFAADDGRFIAARTATWRLYDFFWMLHTMDYVGRDNFNNPLIVIVGLATLWLSISGMLLLIKSFRWKITRTAG